ncbi:MAG: type I-E CRISPR-associated protein Cse2/CasB [Spirochaetes bacterium]|nr:type I-E CRISPR-associated protein Cse2/CasB [Spirochaetota bacterium]MBN2770112.1 type I-E CRISPR-associated protein Cse2/CasB [Spirochaetota bacterium]
MLRRCGDDYFSNSRAFPVFAKIGSLDNRVRSLIAVLYAVYHREGEANSIIDKFNFGKSYYISLKGDGGEFNEEDYKRRDKRFKTIIASDFDQLPFRLRQLIKFIKSKDGLIDFIDLLRDLYNWESDDKWVQRKWVKGFYNIRNSQKEGEYNEQ